MNSAFPASSWNSRTKGVGAIVFSSDTREFVSSSVRFDILLYGPCDRVSALDSTEEWSRRCIKNANNCFYSITAVFYEALKSAPYNSIYSVLYGTDNLLRFSNIQEIGIDWFVDSILT